MFDKCGEGKIAACLVGRALRALGQNPSNRCIQSLLKKFDKKSVYTLWITSLLNLQLKDKNINNPFLDDDKIDFNEFKCIMSSYKFKSEREMLDDVIEAFKVFDREEVSENLNCLLFRINFDWYFKLQVHDIL